MKDISKRENSRVLSHAADESDAGPTFRPLVFICTPLTGDMENNSQRAGKFCRYALDQGQIPLAPALMYPQYMPDLGRKIGFAVFMSVVLMGKCQEMWVLDENVTDDMKKLIERAEKRRQKIRYFDHNFREVMPS